MPRKRLETKLNKISKMLIEEHQPETVQDLQDALKDLLGDTMEAIIKSRIRWAFRLWIWRKTTIIKY